MAIVLRPAFFRIQRPSSSTMVLAGTMLLLVGSTPWFRLNLSASLPRGVYRVGAVQGVAHGSLVVLQPPPCLAAHWPSGVPLLKPVAGMPGDVVCNRDHRLTVNAQDYGVIYPDAHGIRLPQLAVGCHVVPAGHVFLASTAARSLDGRYMGMTPVTTLTASATPVLTWRD